MLGLSAFKGKTIFCLSASHPIGQQLSVRLAHLGATVVALDSNNDVLMLLASKNAARIEPLAMNWSLASNIEILRNAWGTEPIHGVFDFSWLVRKPTQYALPAIQKTENLIGALSAGLTVGQGTVVLGMPSDQSDDDVGVQAINAGFHHIVPQIANALPKIRLLGCICPNHADPNETELTQITDALMMLCHPIARSFASGQIINLLGATKNS